MRISVLVAALTVCWVGLCSAQAARAAPPAGDSASPADELQEVVVTATKRTSTVQDTPASITAVTAEDIAQRGLVDFNAIAQSVPGIAMRTSGPGETEFEMRGLNSSGGNSSMVGFYIDETPLSSPAWAEIGRVVVDPNLYDLARVEVLRGPQGTLYGSSSMGGTVKLIPNAPQLGTFAASGESLVSNTDGGNGLNHHENGMLNLPIGDTAALRVVASSAYDSGWIERRVIQDGAIGVDTGAFPEVSRPANFYTAPIQEEIDGANYTNINSVRASLLWQPQDNLSITPMAMYQLTQQGAPNNVDVNGVPTDPSVPTINAHWEPYDTTEPQSDRFTLGSLKIEYKLDAFTITSATGNWNRDLVISEDCTEEDDSAWFGGAAAPYDPPGGIGPTGPSPTAPGCEEKDYTQQFSEELRLTSNGTGPLQWLAGYYYQDFHSQWDLWLINPQAIRTIPPTGGTNLYVDYMPQSITQNAEFGELSWQFTPQLKAAVSLRHYKYSLSQTNTEWGFFTVNGDNSTPYDTAAGSDASGTNPKFDLSYNLTQDMLLYATAAKGFRLGGVNQPIPVGPCDSTNAALRADEAALQLKLLNNTVCNNSILLQAPPTFDSDSVWNYEIGEKSEWLDRRLIVNVSAYYERWTNPQIATNLAGYGLTVNGGDARIEGLEAEMQAILAHDWDVEANVGYTDAQFTESNAFTGYPNGTLIPDTPKVTAAGTLRWKTGLTSSTSLMAALEVDYVGTRTDAPYGETISLENANQLLIHLPSYALANFRVGLIGDVWTATLFADNLANKEVLLDPEPQIAFQTAAYTRYTVNQPFTVGIDLTYRFH
jgi:iron complex outermembrane recepter protein